MHLVWGRYLTKKFLLQHLVEFNDLEARLIPVGMAMIRAKGEFPLDWDGTVLPEPFDRLIVKAIVGLVQENASQFAIPKAGVEGFEARQFLHDRVGDRLAPARGADLRVLGKKAERAL